MIFANASRSAITSTCGGSVGVIVIQKVRLRTRPKAI
jgi:hypothetical protein